MTTHETIEGFNTKQTLFGRDRPQLVLSFSSHSS
jgi:hypothetical protein